MFKPGTSRVVGVRPVRGRAGETLGLRVLRVQPRPHEVPLARVLGQRGHVVPGQQQVSREWPQQVRRIETKCILKLRFISLVMLFIFQILIYSTWNKILLY